MNQLSIILLITLSSIYNLYNAYIPTIYANGGENIVDWNEIMNEYEDPNYDGAPFWYACIEAPSNIRVSSTLNPQGKYNYSSDNLHS